MATPGSEPQPFVPALSVATLHPHHHPHHHHHGGTGASGGAAGGGGGGGGFNLPLNRGLERALEEAANSGGLNLSARKLKEFPRTAAPAHDLSDTVQAGERGPSAGCGCGCLAGCRAFPGAVASVRSGLTGGSSGPCCPEAATRVGGPAGGERGCSGPPSPRARGSPLPLLRRGSGRGAGTCGRVACAQWKWEVSGGCGRFLGPAQGLGTRAPRLRLRPGRKPSLRRGAARPGWEASRQRWRALRRPEGTAAVPPGPPRRHHRAIRQLVPAASSSCVCVRRERRLWSRN